MCATFDKTAVLVGDAVYHLTLQINEGIRESTAMAMALQEGQDWYDRNQEIVRCYERSHGMQVLFLKDYLDHPQFPDYIDQMDIVYASSNTFRGTVDEFIQTYTERVVQRRALDRQGAERIREIARDYLMMESALFCCAKTQGWHSMCYPGSISTFQAIASGQVPEAPERLQNFAFVSFRLKKSGWVQEVEGPSDVLTQMAQPSCAGGVAGR